MSEAEASYEFDPCSIDESDKEEEPVTLDNWKPSTQQPKIVASQWRQDAIGTNFNQQPGLDELHKIHMFLKKKAADADIMKAFGITAETLVAIKKEKYDPIDGIALDNQSKIYKEFRKVEEKIEGFVRGLNYIAEIMFIDKEEKAKFKKSMKKPKKVKAVKKPKPEINEESEEICEQNDEFHEHEEE
jgi:hypothetical protein